MRIWIAVMPPEMPSTRLVSGSGESIWELELAPAEVELKDFAPVPLQMRSSDETVQVAKAA